MKKLLIFSLLGVCLTSTGQDLSVLTTRDVARLELVLGATISEQGDQIAYYKLVPMDPFKENAPADFHLYVHDLAQGESRPYITSHSVNNATFRPGHRTITFTARKEGDKASSLYEIPLSGGEAQKIYGFDNPITQYDWHPEGNRILLVVPRSAVKPEESSLPYQPEIYEENLRKSGLVVTDSDGTNTSTISLDIHVRSAQWSPDGKWIAVVGAPTSLVDDSFTSMKIYLLDAGNLGLVATIDHKAKLGMVRWSPDSKQIAFIAGEDQHDPVEGRIFTVGVEGGQPGLLNRDFAGSFDQIEWKDNGTLYFLASEGVFTTFGTITSTGEISRILDKQDIAFVQFSAADNGVIALTGSTTDHPHELYLLEAGSSQPEKLTDSNQWLTGKSLGRQEVITYQAADGLLVEGILIHPVNPSPDKIPLITVVHGGPESHYDQGWLTGYSSPGQMAAGQGYAVFYPNYRGSTGRGIDYAKSSQGDPAGKEFDDIIDGIDYLIENYNVDRDKVGVTGGSYGGYATAWMSTRYTDRFAAGVMFVGISNNISKWGTSDIPEEMYLVHSRKRIWEDYQFFLERSPVYYAGQARTPLLIMAGKEDTRVDPGQSYELYRHIKTRTDTPVRLVLYPGEGHGNRNATSRFDYSLRMMRWFNEFLLDPDNEIPETSVRLEAGEIKER